MYSVGNDVGFLHFITKLSRERCGGGSAVSDPDSSHAIGHRMRLCPVVYEFSQGIFAFTNSSWHINVSLLYTHTHKDYLEPAA